MMLHEITALLALGAPPSEQQGQGGPPLIMQLFPFILMFVMLYFVLIRPQQKRAREHQELLKSLKPGDKVLTSGGIVATVVTVKDKTVTVRSADTKVEILKSAVSEITERGGEVKES